MFFSRHSRVQDIPLMKKECLIRWWCPEIVKARFSSSQKWLDRTLCTVLYPEIARLSAEGSRLHSAVFAGKYSTERPFLCQINSLGIIPHFGIHLSFLLLFEFSLFAVFFMSFPEHSDKVQEGCNNCRNESKGSVTDNVEWEIFDKKREHVFLMLVPCSNGQRAGSSPKYRASASAFLPCKQWSMTLLISRKIIW